MKVIRISLANNRIPDFFIFQSNLNIMKLSVTNNCVVESQQWRHLNNMWNLVKVNNACTWMSPFMLFLCLYSEPWTSFKYCISVSIFDFEQVDDSLIKTYYFHKIHLTEDFRKFGSFSAIYIWEKLFKNWPNKFCVGKHLKARSDILKYFQILYRTLKDVLHFSLNKNIPYCSVFHK